MKRLYILTFITLLSACITWGCKGIKSTTVPFGKGLVLDKNWLVNKGPILCPAKDRRPPDQTFLTYPEWFLVYSSEEQANYFKTHTATSFPYLTHINQIWRSYGIVKDQIRGNFKYNFGYHAMIKVIGISTTIEYSVKSIYENSVGRLTNPWINKKLTEEDLFYSDYMCKYVDFIKIRPWYEFNFMKQVPVLWKTPLFGRHPVRKLERKAFLTTELVLKSIYGQLIKWGSHSAYGEALPNTVVVIDKLPSLPISGLSKMCVEAVYPDSSALVSLPRYDEFNSCVTHLALNGINFMEIAGNNTAILLTVITAIDSKSAFGNSQTIFTQLVSSEPSKKRIALAVPVREMSKLIVELKKENVVIEHIYDF